MQTVRRGAGEVEVLSSFEYQSAHAKEKRSNAQILVSNSLSFRKSWVENFGGVARLPSEVRKKATKLQGEEEVIWVGADFIRDEEWKRWMG